MASPDATGDSEQGNAEVIEIPADRVEAVITIEDLASRLEAKHGKSPGSLGDLARRLAQELRSTT